mmetsp:Transcript_9113/g.28921  ORF Transcript_9113/g.28921 Transcript_9113/m.28921 type:complete len:319 (+) Transcript_9113:963-1919(+)
MLRRHGAQTRRRSRRRGAQSECAGVSVMDAVREVKGHLANVDIQDGLDRLSLLDYLLQPAPQRQGRRESRVVLLLCSHVRHSRQPSRHRHALRRALSLRTRARQRRLLARGLLARHELCPDPVARLHQRPLLDSHLLLDRRRQDLRHRLGLGLVSSRHAAHQPRRLRLGPDARRLDVVAPSRHVHLAAGGLRLVADLGLSDQVARHLPLQSRLLAHVRLVHAMGLRGHRRRLLPLWLGLALAKGYLGRVRLPDDLALALARAARRLRALRPLCHLPASPRETRPTRRRRPSVRRRHGKGRHRRGDPGRPRREQAPRRF